MWPASARARGKAADGSPKPARRSKGIPRASSPSPLPSPPASPSRSLAELENANSGSPPPTPTSTVASCLLSRPPWLADIIDRHQAPIPRWPRVVTRSSDRRAPFCAHAPHCTRCGFSTSAPSRGQSVIRCALRRAPSPCNRVGSWWFSGLQVGAGV